MLGLMAQATTVFGLDFNVTLASLTNHNTSAYPAYNQANFDANFGTTTWVNQNGTTMPVDPTKMDESLNPITPGHVSKTDVHTLIPNRRDLRWFAHATPWFGTSSHISIGLTNNLSSYVAAMITDMKNRGFNGVVIDWYGQGHSTDGATQKIKSYLASIPGNTFTYIIMVDKGVQGGTSTNNLVTQIQYCQNQYFSDTNYEHEPLANGKPILMFFGVRSTLGAAAMIDLKAETGGNMVWVEQGTSYLSESWEDECFEWTHEYDTGVNYSDPFNLAAVTAPYSAIRSSGKKAFGAMCGNFNGTLTKSVSWSMGKYLPSSNGLCVVQRAAAINTAIPSNMTRMQWTTWSDWEEGTQVESGIENSFALSGQVNTSNLLSWTITAGDERTVDHYEIYAATNGGNAAFLVSVRTGVYQTNLSQMGLAPGSYQLYVDAIGKPCIRDHMSQPVSAVVSSGPVVLTDVQPLYQIVWQGDLVSFSVVAGGAQPFSYQWTLNGQNISDATNSAYSFGALTGTNYYEVTISNGQGSVNSSTGALVGVAATFLNPSNYNAMQLTFSGYTNGLGVTNFPVLVRLSTNIPGFSYAQFASPSDGADLRFTSAGGRELPFQIDEWNPAGESQIWVQVPSLATTNDYITAYWGNAADSAMPSWNTNAAVWTTLSGSNNFLLVYHLSQSGFPFADSTLQYPATSGMAPVLTTGVSGHGSAFNGSSQFLNAGLVNSGKTFTLSAWVNIAPTAMSEQTIWCNKQGGWNTAGFDFYVNSYLTNDGIIYFDTADGVGGNVSPRTAAHAVTFGQWHLLTGTMDGVNGEVHVFVDGVDQTINSGVDTAFQATNYVRCGALLTGTPGTTGGLCFNGSMDEVRMENSVRSPAWVWASWATMADSAFATYGAIVPPALTLQCQTVSGQLVLTWTAGTLQSATTIMGPYTDITGASSPYTLVPSSPQQYFRVRVPR
ncbi:MAG TPA: DUF2341 domain-containing protein [Candidatus Binatia bacterium]|jgi:hypothetical protein|nr:DUF2341 domain-containing protein [Candidatus Binatia bacterium]